MSKWEGAGGIFWLLHMSEERCASPMGFNHHPVGRKRRIGAAGGRLGAAGAEGGREDV